MKSILWIFPVLALSSTAMADEAKCVNSKNGDPVIHPKSKVLTCHLRVHVAEAGSVQLPVGLIKSVEIESALRLSVSERDIDRMLAQNPVQVPAQTAHARLTMADGNVLPLTFSLAPKLTKVGKDFCTVRFTGAELGVHDVTSPVLPEWVLRNLEAMANGNPRLRERALALSNQGVERAKVKYGCQGSGVTLLRGRRR